MAVVGRSASRGCSCISPRGKILCQGRKQGLQSVLGCSCSNVLKAAVNAVQSLHVHALATDGGCDEPFEQYWVSLISELVPALSWYLLSNSSCSAGVCVGRWFVVSCRFVQAHLLL